MTNTKYISMNINCLFDVLLYSNLNNIINCLLTCKEVNQLNITYLWELLCNRDHSIDNFTYEKGQRKYLILSKLRRLKRKLHITIDLHDLFTTKYIVAWERRLMTIPNEISILTHITSLILPINVLTTIPLGITNLTNLTILDLAFNNFTSIPTHLTKLNLKRLDLRYNHITHISNEISNLVTLEHLDLCHNELQTINTKLSDLTNLKVLDMAFNKITSIPNELSKLTNLKRLDLYYNRLTCIPDEIYLLPDICVYIQNQCTEN